MLPQPFTRIIDAGRKKHGRNGSQHSLPPLARCQPEAVPDHLVAPPFLPNSLMRSSNSDVASGLAFVTPPVGGGHDNVEKSACCLLAAGTEECVDNMLKPSSNPDLRASCDPASVVAVGQRWQSFSYSMDHSLCGQHME